MIRINFQQEALNDLNDIWEYTYKQRSEKQADKYYATIKLAWKGIVEDPAVEREYHNIVSGLLGLKSGKHIVCYNTSLQNEVEIIRILHERMDLKNRLSE